MVMNNPSPGYDTPPFEWSATPAGSFSDNDYSANGAADGLDPYFVWTDLGGFAHLRKPGQVEPDSHVPKWLPVLIELAEGAQASALVAPERQQALFIPPVYTNEYTDIARGGVVPALINRSFFALVKQDRSLARLMQRVELDIPQEALLSSNTAKQAQRAAPQSLLMAQQKAPRPLAKKVIAFIDDGCAFAQPRFWRGSPAVPASFTPRVKRLWDMNLRSPASAQLAPAAFQAMEVAGEYGREFTDVDLKAMVLARTYNGRVDEEAVYADFAQGTQNNVNRLRGRSAHGTHVMDLGCGPYFVEDTICTRYNAEPANPTWEAAQDAASDADIIFVQLPMDTVQNTSGRGTMMADVINAFTYIISQCPADVQIVVNLSWGALAGSHDGSSMLERYMDQLISAQRALYPFTGQPGANRLQIVVPAGNGYQSRTHANFSLKPGHKQLLQWRTEPDDATESFLELWMPANGNVDVRITTPSGNVLPLVHKGDVKTLLSSTTAPGSVVGVLYPGLPWPGYPGYFVLLALAPTVSPDATRATAEHGVWKVEVINVGNHKIVMDGYIERDDVALHTRRGARQSYFDDPRYDRLAAVDDVQVDPESHPAATYVRREGVFNNIDTGKKTEKVGGLRETDREIAEYSPSGIYSTRPKRAGTKTPITYFAVTEESSTLHGVRTTGTRSAGTVRLSGTSMAAPQIARDLFNALP
jgi:Subtilase family